LVGLTCLLLDAKIAVREGNEGNEGAGVVHKPAGLGQSDPSDFAFETVEPKDFGMQNTLYLRPSNPRDFDRVCRNAKYFTFETHTSKIFCI
jgi:hypothetical protein